MVAEDPKKIVQAQDDIISGQVPDMSDANLPLGIPKSPPLFFQTQTKNKTTTKQYVNTSL